MNDDVKQFTPPTVLNSCITVSVMALIVIGLLIAAPYLISSDPQRGTAAEQREPNPVVELKVQFGTYEEPQTITLELFEDEAPNTVANFITLVEEGKYDHTIFHRIIPGFMVQGGDFTNGDGTGDPGYAIADEFENQTSPPWRQFNRAGIVAMANRNNPDQNIWNTNSSQFFITVESQSYPTHLNERHTIFGQVIGGMDVVNEMARVPTGANDRPMEDAVLVEAKVVSKRDHAYTVVHVGDDEETPAENAPADTPSDRDDGE